MQNRSILIIGYGSIGHKHTQAALNLSLIPVVLTKYPDKAKGVRFITDIKEAFDIKFAIVATPTSRHLEDVESIIKYTNCKNILLEKPVESSLKKSEQIFSLAKKNNLNIKVAYCLRFLNVIKKIKEILIKEYENIRLVNVNAGMYLPDWRPNTDYRKSYSGNRRQGGGVQYDLSHELDYVFMLFGYPEEVLFNNTSKISDLEITSDDYYHIILKYSQFIIDIQLDYFRKNRRSLEVFGENRDIIICDFIKRELFYNEIRQNDNSLFNFNEMYKNQLKEFISNVNSKKLATLFEGVEILKYIEL